MKNVLKIIYCPKCNWLMRAAWMAQEFLTTFNDELDEVCLVPSKASGVYELVLNNTVIFSRKDEQGFPEIKALKQRIRDQIAPEKSLGHSDTPTGFSKGQHL